MTCRVCHNQIHSHNRSEVCVRCRKRRAPANRVTKLPTEWDVGREARIAAYRERAERKEGIFG